MISRLLDQSKRGLGFGLGHCSCEFTSNELSSIRVVEVCFVDGTLSKKPLFVSSGAIVLRMGPLSGLGCSTEVEQISFLKRTM